MLKMFFLFDSVSEKAFQKSLNIEKRRKSFEKASKTVKIFSSTNRHVFTVVQSEETSTSEQKKISRPLS